MKTSQVIIFQQQLYLQSWTQAVKKQFWSRNNIPAKNLDNNRFVNVSNGEQRPIEIIQKNNSEELSFGIINIGKKCKYSERYSKILRSETRRLDLRACTTPKLFYDYKKLELLQIRKYIHLPSKIFRSQPSYVPKSY